MQNDVAVILYVKVATNRVYIRSIGYVLEVTGVSYF